VRELERIRRIAESAAASLSGRRPSTVLPRTTSEAYDVLGVNADVSEGVLKKIVDALRMSWHPDHARDEEDRLCAQGAYPPDQYRLGPHHGEARGRLSARDRASLAS
jgi:hypothetical protein